ncbi:glycosyl transferase [Pelagibacteraceae bacterium]|nr:glycosyl transferase [Pelagibacteraceae bacterium]
MPVNKIIISSSDSKYFLLLKELYLSLRKQDILNEYHFAVLNTGMNKNQIDYLRDNKIKVKDAIWNTKVPSYKILGRDHLKTQVARAFLPDYFENYKVYIWLDADLWINDLESFLLYEKGALQNNLTITPQSDRAYFNNAKVEWFMNFPTKVKTINFKNISKSISKKLAKKYAFYSTLNAGAFGISDSDEIWKCFQKNINLAAKRGRIFGTDQVALALTVHEDKIPTQFLPSYCNWMCEFHLPIFNEKINKFLEPYLPNHPIGLVHLAGLDDIRNDKKVLSNIKNTQGEVIQKSLRFNV